LWSPDGTKLVYMKGYDVYVSNIMLKTEQKITSWDEWGNYGLKLFSYSGNGSELYLYAMGDLWAIPVNGSGRIQITHNNSYNSYMEKFRSGKYAYFNYTGYPTELWFVDLGKTNKPKLLASDLNCHPYSSLDLNPDGSEVVFSAEMAVTQHLQSSYKNLTGIWVINSDGTNRRQISNQFGSQLSWSPNSNKIAFLRDDELWFINPDGTGEEKVLTQALYIKYFKWSPDGSRIAYWASPTIDGNCTSLWIIDLVAHTEIRVLNTANTGVFGKDMSWNPDGNMIAFITTGSPEEQGYAKEQVLLLKFISDKPKN